MNVPPVVRIAVIVATASAAAWLLLHPLAWPARALTTILVVPLPAVLMLQTKVADAIPRESEREAVYVSSALSVWILAAFAMLAARFSDFSRHDLRLVGLPIGILLAASTLTLLAGLAVLAGGRLLRLRESPLVRFLIPRYSSEKIAFVGLSLSAGIAEEVVFRSFLIAAVLLASGSMLVAVLVSLAVFSASHAYQGWTGVLRVALLGLILTVPFLVTGSVYPSMIAHAALDIVAGVFLADWLGATPGDRS